MGLYYIYIYFFLIICLYLQKIPIIETIRVMTLSLHGFLQIENRHKQVYFIFMFTTKYYIFLQSVILDEKKRFPTFIIANKVDIV